MNKNKFYTWIIVGLLISNAILLFFHLNRPNHKMRPKEIVVDRLKFDNEQVKAYELIIEKHKSVAEANNDKIKALKNELYDTLNGQLDSIKNDSLNNAISTCFKNIEVNNYNHFLEIKQICKPTQLNDFKLLTEELTNIFSGRRNKNDKKN